MSFIREEKISEQVRRRSETVIEKERVDFLNTGSILLNLAASQKARNGGWARGRIINIVGDGSSGKSLSAIEALAQAYYHPTLESTIFKKPETRIFKYWNREIVMDFPLEAMYKQKFVDAVEWSDKCETVEQWGRDVLRSVSALRPGEFFIGVADSLDSMDSEEGKERLEKSIRTDKPLDGSYGTGKAKFLSASFFTRLCLEMQDKDATLILISQVREKIDAMAFGEKYYRSGGKALDFYTHQVPWLAQIGKLSNKYEEKSRAYGVKVKARFKRNKTALPFREVEFNILFDYGIDDIGGMVDFLSAERIQKAFKDTFGRRVTREELISEADENDEIYELLVDTVEAYWNEIEQNTKVFRSPRFEE